MSKLNTKNAGQAIEEKIVNQAKKEGRNQEWIEREMEIHGISGGLLLPEVK
jgi:hypothetical protein